MPRIPYDELVKEFERVLLSRNVPAEDAQIMAKMFADTSADGVYSHGVNRFPRVISYIDKGYIDVNAKPTVVGSFGSFERWNGNLGFGNLNAKKAMDRAIELAKQHGIGLVAIGNTNHWMRGGTYGWQAADAGCIGICWTNTQPNMPAWGAKDRRIGNNPFVLAIPRANGQHIVSDCAVAQYSYGKIETCKLNGQMLPYPGGFDSEGNLTSDPAEIEKTWRVLPMGYWKGSSISIALDLMAAVLSGENTVTDVGRLSSDEYGLSQVVIAIDPTHMSGKRMSDEIIDTVLEDIKASEPVREGGEILYPGERAYRTRLEHMKNGIPVVDSVWETIKAL